MTRPSGSARLRIGPGISLETFDGSREFTEFQRALLLLLGDAGPTGLRRERIAEVLWDDRGASATSPRRRLRQLAYAINQRAGIDLVVGDPDRLALDEGVQVLWIGGSLDARIPAPTRAFAVERDEIEARARLRSREDVVGVLDAARITDDPDRILDVLRRQADAGSLWRDGVWALLRLGRIREAESVLASLGIEDEDVLRKCRAMMGRLLAGHLTGPNRDAAGIPLFGRVAELTEATRAVERGDTRVALVGPSGVGLSRLLGATSAWALTETDDLVVASAHCSATGRTIPYDTLNRLFDSDLFRAAYHEVEEPWKSVIARVLVRAIGETPAVDIPRLEGTSATLRVLHGIAALVEKAVGRAQLLAVVDDLHHADPASLTVLTHLGYEGDGAVVRMLGSVRTDQAPSDTVEAFLRKEATVVRVEPLDHDSSASLVRALHPEVSEGDARTLASLCDGFPMRLVEASRAVADAGGHLGHETLGELLERRLKDLDPVEQEVVALLALQPGGSDADLLMAGTGAGTLQVARAVGELTRRGLTREESDGGTVRISSPFLRDKILGGIPVTIRRALHKRIAAKLELRVPPPAAEVGYHLALAGLGDEAALQLINGAHQAAGDEAFPVAIELMQQARDAASHPLPPAELDFWGELLEAEGRFGEAVEVYPRAEEGWIEAGAEEKALWSRLGWLRSGVEEAPDVNKFREEVLSLIARAQEFHLDDLEAETIDVLFMIAGYAIDAELTWDALGILVGARRRGSTSPRLDFVEVRRAYIDDPNRAQECAWRYHASTTPGSSNRLASLVRIINQGLLRGDSGDEDVRLAMSELGSFSSGCDPHLKLTVSLSLGTWHLERGELSQAEERLKLALSVVRGIPKKTGSGILSNLAEIALARGRLSEAESYLSRLDELGERSPRDVLITDALKALISIERGSVGRAKGLIEDSAHFRFDQPCDCFPYIVARARATYYCRIGRRVQAEQELSEAVSRAASFAPRMLTQLNDLRTALQLWPEPERAPDSPVR